MKTLQDKKFIEIDGKVFKLASAKRRVRALLIDVGTIFVVSLLCTLLAVICLKNIEEEAIPYEGNFGDAIGCGDFVESVYVWMGQNVLDIDVAYRDEGLYWSEEESVYKKHNKFITNIVINIPFILPFILPVWIFALFSEWSFGKRKLSLHVLSWEDMKSRDVFWIIDNERKRVRDKFLKKVVVEWDPHTPLPTLDPPEKIAMDALKARRIDAKQQLETSIAELMARVTDAKQQVEISSADARKFQKAYEGALTEATAANADATRAVEDGRKADAREALAIRNNSQRIADRNKTRYEQQQAVVKQHTTLMETLELRTAHIQRKLDMVVTEHTNVDAETELSDILKEMEAFETLKMRLYDVTHQENTDRASGNTVKIAGKNFILASRMTQVYMFFWYFMLELFTLGLATFIVAAYPIVFIVAGICAFFSICYREPSRSELVHSRSRRMWLQVIRLKDGKPCTAIDCFIRRLSGVLQPLDLLWLMGKKRQRLGDKFARTVVVKRGPLFEQTEVETASPEKVLSDAITEMKPHLLAAREKVDAAFEIQGQLHATYESAMSKANQQEANTLTELEAGQEEAARDALEKRNAYQFLAENYKTQAEEQQKVVKTLRDLLAHLEDKIMEAEGQRDVVAAEQRNVEIETQLQDMLEELQQKKVEKVEAMEQDATEAAILAKAMVELDVDYQDVKLTAEFSGYAEDASIEQELNQLKEKIND